MTMFQAPRLHANLIDNHNTSPKTAPTTKYSIFSF